MNENEPVRNSEVAANVRDMIQMHKNALPGKLAPDFTLMQPDGTPLTLSGLRGKIVIIDFWASWCKPCRASNPVMKEFYAEYCDRGVEILGVSNDTDHDKWMAAVEEDGLPWLNVVDDFPVKNRPARVISLYAAPGLPTLVLIDREGRIVSANLLKEDMEAKIKELLED